MYLSSTTTEDFDLPTFTFTLVDRKSIYKERVYRLDFSFRDAKHTIKFGSVGRCE